MVAGIVRHPEDDGKFGDLRGLEGGESQIDPAVETFHIGGHEQHDHQQHQRDNVQRFSEIMQGAIIDVGNKQQRCRKPRRRKKRLRTDKVVNVPAVVVVAGGVAGGEQHDQAVDHHQRQRAHKIPGKRAALLLGKPDVAQHPEQIAKGTVQQQHKQAGGLHVLTSRSELLRFQLM